jgi:hypothetical protein
MEDWEGKYHHILVLSTSLPGFKGFSSFYKTKKKKKNNVLAERLYSHKKIVNDSVYL